MWTRNGKFPFLSFLPSLWRSFSAFPHISKQHIYPSYNWCVWSNLRGFSRLCNIFSFSLANQTLRHDSSTNSSHNFRIHRNFEWNRPCRYGGGRKYCSHGTCRRFPRWSILNIVVWTKETWNRTTMKVGWRDTLLDMYACICINTLKIPMFHILSSSNL